VAAAARRHVLLHHTVQHTVDAWSQAIEKALLGRASHPPGPGPWAQRTTDAVAGWMERPLQRLRALNRARLAKRAR
jgi:hypothetical protein